MQTFDDDLYLHPLDQDYLADEDDDEDELDLPWDEFSMLDEDAVDHFDEF